MIKNFFKILSLLKFEMSVPLHRYLLRDPSMTARSLAWKNYIVSWVCLLTPFPSMTERHTA